MNIISGLVLQDMQMLNRLIVSKGGHRIKMSSNTYIIDTSVMVDAIGDEKVKCLFEGIKKALLKTGLKHYQNQVPSSEINTIKEYIEYEKKEPPTISRLKRRAENWGVVVLRKLRDKLVPMKQLVY